MDTDTKQQDAAAGGDAATVISPNAQAPSSFTRPSDPSQYMRTYAKDMARVTQSPVPEGTAAAASQTYRPQAAVSSASDGNDVDLPDFDPSPINYKDGASPKEFVQEQVSLNETDSEDIFAKRVPFISKTPTAPPLTVPVAETYAAPIPSHANEERESILSRLREKFAHTESDSSPEAVTYTNASLPQNTLSVPEGPDAVPAWSTQTTSHVDVHPALTSTPAAIPSVPLDRKADSLRAPPMPPPLPTPPPASRGVALPALESPEKVPALPGSEVLQRLPEGEPSAPQQQSTGKPTPPRSPVAAPDSTPQPVQRAAPPPQIGTAYHAPAPIQPLQESPTQAPAWTPPPARAPLSTDAYVPPPTPAFKPAPVSAPVMQPIPAATHWPAPAPAPIPKPSPVFQPAPQPQPAPRVSPVPPSPAADPSYVPAPVQTYAYPAAPSIAAPANDIPMRAAAPTFDRTARPIPPVPAPVSAPTPFVAPARTVTPPVQAAPSPLHTFASDFSDRIDERQSSTFAVLAAQSDAGQTPRKASVPTHRIPRPVLAAIAMLVVGTLLIAGAYIYRSTRPGDAPVVAGVPSLIAFDESRELSGTGPALMQALSDASQGDSTKDSIVVTYITTSADGTSGTAQPGGELIRQLALPAPDILLRNVDPSSTVGYIRASAESRPFFILSVNSYERTFAGMLSWEKTMPSDLSILYPAYPDIAQNASSTASTTVHMTLPSAPAFVDSVVANYDVRILRDASGRSILMYGYRTKDQLIIARDEAAFTAIVARLSVDEH